MALLVIAATSVALGLAGVLAAQVVSETREARLGAIVAEVADQSQVIDSELQLWEGQLRGLSAAAEQLLQHGTPTEPTTWAHTAFVDGADGPPDLRPSSRYRRPVSFRAPVHKLAPGVAEDHIADALARLGPLDRIFQRMFLTSGGLSNDLDDAALHQALGETGVPLAWSYVALESGTHISYPGHGPYPLEFDPRERPWYQMAESASDLQWGSPYPDVNGLGLILPCTTALRTEDGELLGVAGVELTFETVIERLLAPDHAPGDEAFLLDEGGRVVVRSTERGLQFAEGIHGNRARDLVPIHHDSIVEAVKRGESGVQEVEGGSLVVYRRLEHLGWSYVVEAEVPELLW